MVIQSNIPALNAHRNLALNNRGIAQSLERLSSGFRINRAADDAAGLAISERMRGQIRGLSMAQKNVSQGINLVQTADGALQETHAILQRMRELAVQSSNGTFQDSDRSQIEHEFQALKKEIDRIAQSTHYNNIRLLDGSLGSRSKITQPPPVDVQVPFFLRDKQYSGMATGSEQAIFEHLHTLGFAGYNLSVILSNIPLNPLAGQATDLIIEGGNNPQISLRMGNQIFHTVISTPENNTFTMFTYPITGIGGNVIFPIGGHVLLCNNGFAFGRIDIFNFDLALGGQLNQPLAPNMSSGVIHGIQLSNVTTTPVLGGFAAGWTLNSNPIGPGHALYNAWIYITESEIPEPIEILPRGLILQIGANAGHHQRMTIFIENMGARWIGAQTLFDGFMSVYETSITTREKANDAIVVLDGAVNMVSAERARLGAYQNRLESTLNSLGVARENLTASESAIRDADMAAEMMRFTKANILSQAAGAMLAQANQLPQGIVQMLR